MKTSSLSVRLILLACLSISLALIATTFVLNALFHDFFEERIFSELDRELIQLTANLSIEQDGNLSVEPLANPRFNAPFSGLYWQAVEPGKHAVTSRSLWGGGYDFPPNPIAGQRDRLEIDSKQGIPLLVIGWTILIGEGDEQRAITLSVATPESEVDEATARFRSAFILWLALMFVGLIIASWVQVRLGLVPLETLRKKVEQVRSGAEDKLEGPFPSEVQPLATEVNELLTLHETSLADARERASDLAHGLKTPLTVMQTIARDLRKIKQDEQADEIDTQVASMQHYIERELARVRTQMPRNAMTPIAPVVDKMVSTIRRFPRETPLEWHVDISDDMNTPFDEHDLSELLGNLLDNARKWANSQVQIHSSTDPDGRTSITIEDDGPGVPDEMLTTVLARGERLDPSVQGTGLGLAICADIAESYGADFILAKSPLGGLSVTIMWQQG
ncbi:MAG: ATP-binding protein [Rhodobacteraceae bacterium]|nr:MAG: ATP-binding protein [Paracoccaceae bacterium]